VRRETTKSSLEKKLAWDSSLFLGSILTNEEKETILEPLWSISPKAMATTITLKKIPAGLYESLNESASRHRRSLNGKIIALLEEKLQAKKRRPEDILASARALRKQIRGAWMTTVMIDRAKKEGRP
jgi:hypothetical protein